MRTRLSGLALMAISLSPAGASAADLPSTAAPPAPALLSPAPVAGWTGLYAGSYLGGAVGVFSDRAKSAGSWTALGGATGALVGYAWRSGAVVYGVEGDLGANNLDRKFAAAPGMVASQAQSIDSVHLRARAGYDLGGFLPFVAGGVAENRSVMFQRAPLDFEGQTRDRAGWTLGAGVDVALNLPILGPTVMRAEYLYEALPAATYDLGGPVVRESMSAQYARLALITTMGEGWRGSPDEPAAWDGNYVGAMGGLSGHRIATQGLGEQQVFAARGPIEGVYSGYNWMFGHGMLGVDGATLLADVAGRGPEPGAASIVYQNFLESDFRARAGYAVGRFMPFLAAGLDFGASQQTDAATGATKGNLPVLAGTVGAGIEFMATDLVAVRAEYLHSHSLADDSTHLDGDQCCAQTRFSNSIRVGAAYFFH
ncbi:MAG: outer membrane beta-barrel protein [Roseiarcus sp.]